MIMARILFIDDDEPLRKSLCGLLTKSGFEVREADNGRTALNLLREQPVDLVITDMVMPEVEGVEIIQTLRRTHPTVKIIAMSGGDQGSADCYLKMARLLGADAVLAKPFNSDELLAAVRQLL